jgi:hypothetical protein
MRIHRKEDSVKDHLSLYDVVFIAEDSILSSRIRSMQGNGVFSFRVLSSFKESERGDIFVIPVHTLAKRKTAKEPFLPKAPIIAYGRGEDISLGFLSGCEDYLKDPWDVEELLYRLERVCKRLSVDFKWGYLELAGCTAGTASDKVLLTQHEARILKLLMAHRGEVVPKEALQYAAWGAVYPSSRRLGMCIHSLRKKLETIHPGEGNHHSILTMYGEGYSIS